MLPGILLLAVCFILQNTVEVYASAGNLPWETPLSTIQKSLSGPVASAVLILVIVGAGVMLAVGEFGSTIRRILQIVIGVAVVVRASDFISQIFGTVNGALFP
jgi:type IV secretion system protein VirB2